MILMMAGFPVMTATAAVCTATSSGNWSTIGIWSCGYVPTSSDDVLIDNGLTVTLDVTSTTVNSLTILDGNGNTSLSLGTNALTVANDINILNSNNGTTKSLDVGAGTLTIGGNLNFTEGAGTRVTQVTLSTGTVTVNGNINVNPGGTLANAKVIFTGAGGILNVAGNYASGGTLTVANGTVNYTGAAQTVLSQNYYNLGLSGSGVKTLQAGTTAIGGNFNFKRNSFCHASCR